MQLNKIEQRQSDGTFVRGWISEQRGYPLIVFLHGNGFASGLYTPMLQHLTSQYDLLLLDIPGHGSSDKVTPFPGWNDAAERLHNAAKQTGLLSGRQVYGIGHSLGGVFTLLSAYRHPQTYVSLILLDPIIFPPSMLLLMRCINAVGLTKHFHPNIKATLRRRRQWGSRDEVAAYFRGRSVFRNWTEESLQGFANYAINDTGNGVTLACDPEVEAAFFGSVPQGLWSALGGVSKQTTVVMGETSYPFTARAARIALKRNQNISQEVVPGSHCFMQEYPEMAAQKILDILGKSATGRG